MSNDPLAEGTSTPAISFKDSPIGAAVNPGRLVDGVIVSCPICGGEDLALPTYGQWNAETPHDPPHLTVTFLVKHRCQKSPKEMST